MILSILWKEKLVSEKIIYSELLFTIAKIKGSYLKKKKNSRLVTDPGMHVANSMFQVLRLTWEALESLYLNK